MGVNGFISAAVLNNHGVTVTAFFAGMDNAAIAGGFNRCAGRRRVVSAFMGPDGIQYRMPTVRVKARTDAGKVDGIAQELFTHALAGRVVIAGIAFVIGKADGGDFPALVIEAGNFDVAVTDALAIDKHFVVNQADAGAPADIQRKVDIPAKNSRYFNQDLVRNTGLVAIQKSGVVNHGAGMAGAIIGITLLQLVYLSTLRVSAEAMPGQCRYFQL